MQPSGYGTGNRAPGEATDDAHLDAVFAALADPTRRSLLAHLAEGSATVSELASPLSMSQPAVSKHLKVLEKAGLVSVGRDGTSRPRTLRAAPLAEASAWLQRYRRYCEESFARLDDLLLDVRKERSN